MRNILILTGRYLPGHKDGGPLRTIINITDTLGDEYNFYIACLDRDHGDTEAYSDISYDEWNKVGKANVWYIKPGTLSFDLIKTLAIKSKANVIYTCGFFDDYGYKTLILNKLNKLNQIPVVVASMGTFSKGALAQKSTKKHIFIEAFKALGLFKNITWSVTSELEEKDVQDNINAEAKCIIAEDLPRANVPGIKEKNSTFSVAFLSRISPKKNLLGAINLLKNVKSNVEFYIYGPDEDKEYWSKCNEELNKLPSNIKWFYKGDVPSEDVQQNLANHDVFLFPTLGENYGHVIFEALSVGCIPVISDQTPWQVIADNNAGYVLDLNDMNRFSSAIDELAAMTSEERKSLSLKCVEIANKKVEENKRKTGYRTIFG